MDTWRAYPAAQQPTWPDRRALDRVVAELAAAAPLARPDEIDRLRVRLAAVALGEAYLLQGGDCAETLEAPHGSAGRTLDTLLQMALVLGFATELPVVKVGRMAGQYAKPRSEPTETRDGVTLPSYRGDAVNRQAFTAGDRTPDPGRMLRAYRASAATVDRLHAAALRGRPDLRTVNGWNRSFVANSPMRERYQPVADQIDASIDFATACGLRPDPVPIADFYISHEALLLDYESALTRTDRRTGRRYAGSGHMLWIGERTRQIDGAHVEFASQVANPIGVKLGPTATADEALALVDRLDPDREPGRLMFITRMGAARIRDLLPSLVEKVGASGAQIAWICDPMHGNTTSTASGYKTRHVDAILDEVRGFFEVHQSLGTHPGGVHLELTGDDVTECLGGGHEITLDELPLRYRSACDPRLNHDQALDLAFLVGEMYLDR